MVLSECYGFVKYSLVCINLIFWVSIHNYISEILITIAKQLFMIENTSILIYFFFMLCTNKFTKSFNI